MVLADSPLSCILFPDDDLLDANETTCAVVDVDRVGFVDNQQVKRLAALASGDRRRSYGGPKVQGCIRWSVGRIDIQSGFVRRREPGVRGPIQVIEGCARRKNK